MVPRRLCSLRQGQSAATAAIFVASLIGCAALIEPRPTVSPPAGAIVEKSVGVYYAPEFRARQDEVAAGDVVFATGPSSVALFDQLLPKVFAAAVTVDSLNQTDKADGASVVFEPRIDSFTAVEGPGPGRSGHAVAITYRFVLHTPNGGDLAEWKVTGEAENTSADAAWADLATHAMEDAARRFLGSFREVPEAKRWARGLSLADVNANGAALTRAPAPDFAPGAMRAAYPSIVEFAADALPDLTGARGLLALRVVVRNTGTHRIMVRRTDVDLVLPDGHSLQAATPSQFAAAATERYARVGPVAGGVGVAAIPLLIVSLVNAAINAKEQGEFEANQAKWRSEGMSDLDLMPSQKAEGYYFFVEVPAAHPAAPGITLRLSAIDYDIAVRYPMTLLLSEPSAEFQPFKSGSGAQQ